jgi:hypothetical protein
VLAYGALAAYTYCLYGLGPILAFLRDELHLSYTVTSLHSGPPQEPPKLSPDPPNKGRLKGGARSERVSLPN